MSKISVIINTLNEEKNLPGALDSIKKLADEVVVVDMKSIDSTRAIAKKFGAKVYEHRPMGYVEPARNYAIGKATGDWILILDADERIPSSLRKTIREIVSSPDADYYRLPRKNMIFGKWIQHSGWWPDYNIRFFKKGKVEWNELIHSVPTTQGKGLDLEALEDNALVHEHYTSIEQYITRLNRYTHHQAYSRIKDGYTFSWRDVIQKPSEEFFRRYFQAQGYKDGMHGLALSLLQSFSEAVVYLKIWEAQGFKEKHIEISKISRELKSVQDDTNYWIADTLIKTGSGFSLKNRLKRKLKK